MDTYGKKEARREISMIKVVAANVVMDVLDRAIQVHGALGMSDDTPLAGMWRYSRMLKVADGPDEVHKMVIARRELNRWASRDADGEPSGAGDQPASPAANASPALSTRPGSPSRLG
jgi:acyl-CoA dehydrogenase